MTYGEIQPLRAVVGIVSNNMRDGYTLAVGDNTNSGVAPLSVTNPHFATLRCEFSTSIGFRLYGWCM